MSTHNIGFYEDLTKIIFQLSSNIIKYAPYFFCCRTHESAAVDQQHEQSSIKSYVVTIYYSCLAEADSNS